MKRICFICLFLVGFIFSQKAESLGSGIPVKELSKFSLPQTVHRATSSAVIFFFEENPQGNILFDLEDEENDRNKKGLEFVAGFLPGYCNTTSKNKVEASLSFPDQKSFIKIFILNSVFRV